ncbi:YhfC family intramembrane metalloprotease [Paenibacillus allorhizosphaerae]|uniref:YhfC family intramembrane metalloprotease n=1 Tax=Paenibacillus allorhizosphaerae TaxID=2849866 RepID=A0ABM8VPW1_9BACL|nr:YhfC family intramembrane metalloprotease [Paenibacillus allorhizosphaerae]CAG7653466.1 hypothetical protein PAECIP111802_05490 [Paenibacillus allorhizosphaerae]
MAGSSTLIGIVIQMTIVLALVITAAVYLLRKERIALKPMLIGALVFLLFSQVLEKGLHVYMLQLNPVTAAWLQHAWLFATYGALAAGVFEELGRYVAFRWWLKRRRSWGDGLSFGLGHSGVEALLIGVVGGAQMLALAVMYNNGTLQQKLGGLPPETAEALVAGLSGTPLHLYVLGGVERIAAFLLHLAFSIMVLQGVRSRRFHYVLAAIGLHAAVDFVPALYQAKAVSVYAAEAVVVLAGIAGFMYLRRMKKNDSREWLPESDGEKRS